MSEHFDDLEAFFADVPARRHATEVDCGLTWREEPEGQDHRVSWITETNELIVVALASDGGHEGDEAPEAVELLGEAASEQEALELTGQCAFPGSEARSLPQLRELVA